jgi:hypothetical protein
MRVRLEARRGSALILVLMMTLAVAGLSIAAIFLSSSAGLLSRFYDRERDFRLAAEAALAQLQSRLSRDTTLAFPDTGFVQLLSGFQPADATGGVSSNVRVNVYAAMTGDTTGLETPHLTLIAASYDANGTRHVRRMDLRSETFARYSFLTDSFSASYAFGPGTVPGRVHSNEAWRTGNAPFGATYLDSVTAIDGFSGAATYSSDTSSAILRVVYPADSTYPGLQSLASAAHLSFAPVSGTGAGWTRGSRLEFVAFDADGSGVVDDDEGFVRVFDLAENMDTTRLRVGLREDQSGSGTTWREWNSRDIQNQCGAFYYRNKRWQFFPVAVHRAAWVGEIIDSSGSAYVPSIGSMNQMEDYDADAVRLILGQSTARCFPAGSPYLVNTERMTNHLGEVTGTDADTIPFGAIVPAGGWPSSAPAGYGGDDTTFTQVARTCTMDIGVNGRCVFDTDSVLGSWRPFGGTQLSGVATTLRQDSELSRLWPYSPSANDSARRVIFSNGRLLVSGRVRGRVTLLVNGDVEIIDRLTYVTEPSQGVSTACTDQLGLLAVGDVLVTDNALTTARRYGTSPPPSSDVTLKYLGGASDFSLHANIMSLSGTVGVANPSATGVSLLRCPQQQNPANTAGGCLRFAGSMVMRRFSPHHNGNFTGYRYTGMKDPCQFTNNRPPFFPLTNRYTLVRTLEIEPSRATTPAKIRAILLRLKGKAL